MEHRDLRPAGAATEDDDDVALFTCIWFAVYTLLAKILWENRQPKRRRSFGASQVACESCVKTDTGKRHPVAPW